VRLQLIVLAAALAPAATVRGADVEGAVRAGVYTDDDATTIWTVASSVSGNVTDEIQVSARYLVDAVSSASVDVISQATTRFEDTRHDVSGSVAYKGSERSVSGTYSHSREEDWVSHNFGLSASHDFYQKNLTLSLTLGYQTNDISRANSAGFSRALSAYLATVSAVFTLTTRDLLEVGLASSLYDGFQASPYRYLFVEGLAILENYPERRFRQAVLLRHHHYFDIALALRSHARIYFDTYRVRALTLGTEAVLEGLPLEVALAVRAYGQTRAGFYREQYSTAEEFMAIDKELSTFVDVFAGPILAYESEDLGAVESLRVEARASVFVFRFFDFAALDGRLGLVADLGISLSF
jgi:hypothetical protein